MLLKTNIEVHNAKLTFIFIFCLQLNSAKLSYG
jgi:hypothetical protein